MWGSESSREFGVAKTSAYTVTRHPIWLYGHNQRPFSGSQNRYEGGSGAFGQKIRGQRGTHLMAAKLPLPWPPVPEGLGGTRSSAEEPHARALFT
jgi:hypothetical protein